MIWSSEARRLLDQLLAYVPSLLRADVAEKARLGAEANTREQGGTEVEVNTAVEALIGVVPDRLRPRIREGLESTVIDHYR
ncbi:MAG TPA: hypothetical protein VEG32_08855 [Clostridia bacterium]|nr:hypothetical protein [Clostridia bacterium]